VIRVRILIFHGYSLCGSGGNVYIAGLTRCLLRQGHDVQLLCQEKNPAEFDFVDAVGRWPAGRLRVERVRRPARCTAYVPDIGGLLPVYVTGYFPGYQTRPFPELTEAQVTDYLAANTAAVRDVISLAEPDYALANHLVLGPAILARALPSRVPYAVRVHPSALEWTVRPHAGRFGGYARHGLATADVVLVGSGRAAEELWEVMRQPDLPARTRLLPPGAEFAAQHVRPPANRGDGGDAYPDIPRLSLAGHRK
jgi:Glycosyl transferase 4-like domain